MSKNVVYWASTVLLCALYVMSAALYITQGETVRTLLDGLGYPGYLVTVLIVAKIAGIIAILWRVSVALSDLAYAGMFYHLLLAISAHLNVHDYRGGVPALLGLVFLLTSFFTQNFGRAKPSPYLSPPIEGHNEAAARRPDLG